MDLRASDADREATVERLRVAAMEGRLDSDELEERLHAAYGARHCSDLARLTADVTPVPRPAAVQAPAGPPVFVKGPATNGLAIASLICSLVWLGWIGSIAAVLFGHVALRQIRASGGLQGGRGAAIAGLALGYLGLATLLLVLFGIAID